MAMEINGVRAERLASEAAKHVAEGTRTNDVAADKSPTGMGAEAAEGINDMDTHVRGERSGLDSRVTGRSFRAGADRSGSEPLANRGWVHESGYGGKGGEPRISSDQREDSERGTSQSPTQRIEPTPDDIATPTTSGLDVEDVLAPDPKEMNG